jgi:N-acetyl sugar amidotransferase
MSSSVAEKKIRSWVDIAQSRKGANIFDRPVSGYQICTQCIMDTSDPEITFDASGVCSHCHNYDNRVQNEVFKGDEGKHLLDETIETIRREGKGKRYDCILGLSGGVDSTYVAYLCKKVYGLRPLAVHLDNGWNSEIAVRNIENIVSKLDLDLYTEVLNWDEFRRLQVSFLKGSTPDSEIPTDHAIISTLYKTAIKNKIRFIMDGSNVVTEIMVPATWSHGHADWKYIKTLNDQFSDGNVLKTYPHYTYFQYLIEYPRIRKLVRFPILNYIDFNKMAAMEIMKRELDWEPYGYILPTKFGFDKRRSHLSCLVKNGRITRDDALREMQNPPIPDEILAEDRAFVTKKLGLSEIEFAAIMKAPRKTFWDYPSYEREIRKAPFWLVMFAVQAIVKNPKRVPAAILNRLGLRTK